MQYEEVQVGDPGPGQARIRHTAIGVNFVDIYQRSGLYPMQLPQVAGNEGAGVVEAVGQGVSDAQAGRPRRLYRPAGLVLRRAHRAGGPDGEAARRASREEQAASMMLKGLTVHYLIHRTYRGEERRNGAVACRRRRRRPDRRPVAEGSSA